jgi:hypothetical protein
MAHSGLSGPVSVLAVAMATRAHARPENELVEIIRQYPRLEDVNVAGQAVRELLSMGWLEVNESYGIKFTQEAPDLREKIEDKTGVPGTAERLLQMASLESPVTIVGAMTDAVVYSSFLDILGRAQYRIRLPMLATEPYPDTVRILKERAEAGVRIQLLLGSPALVAKWRGEPMREIAVDRLQKWQRNFRMYKNVEMRVSPHADDMAIATCVGIDDSLVRLDVYDPVTQRSLQGVMIEVESPVGMKLNLVRIFVDLFDNAWRRGLSRGKFAHARWFARRFWKLELGVVVTALAFAPIHIVNWTLVVVGLGTGILAPSLVDEVPRVRRAMTEWRRS